MISGYEKRKQVPLRWYGQYKDSMNKMFILHGCIYLAEIFQKVLFLLFDFLGEDRNIPEQGICNFSCQEAVSDCAK